MSSVSSCDSSVLTWKPSMAAWSAQMGSHSVTVVTQPAAFMAKAQITTRLPASMTSVARQMPSGSECLQPYRLSNLDLVTESLTLIAGKSSSPFFSITYRRCTPVVVSSDTPNMRFAILFHLSGCFARPRLMIVSTILNSAAVVDDEVGAVALRVGGERDRVERALPVLLERLALPREDGRLARRRDRRRRVVLRREDVARAPAHGRAERRERLDEHRRLDRHVERARDARALELLGAVLLARHHETGHLELGELDLLAAEVRERNVRNLVVTHRCRACLVCEACGE